MKFIYFIFFLQVLCDLFEFKSDCVFILVGKVEFVVFIVQRFCIGGMLFGVILREIYEVIVIVMNRIGGKLNFGEGGEVSIFKWYIFLLRRLKFNLIFFVGFYLLEVVYGCG